jgi:hypothetical protein
MYVTGEVDVSKTKLGVFNRSGRVRSALELTKLRRTLEEGDIILVENPFAIEVRSDK